MTDWTDRFVRHRRSLRKLAEQIPLPEGADFRTRMAAVYDWVVDNIDNESRRSVEELETAHSEDEDDVRNTAKHVIEAGRGKGRQIDRVFIGLARALGAQADGLYAVDRRRAFFDPNLLSSAQFDGMLVVVRPPGARDESSIICDPSTAMPFGRVPWWFTGTTGLLVVDDEHRTMQIPPAPPEENATTSEVDIRFAEQNEIYEVDWTQTLTGQDARRTRRWLRQMHVDEREETVRAECGESADLEVLEAAVHELEDPQSPLSFSCTGEVFTADISGDVGTFHFTPGGPWFDALPELRDDERRTHVIFDHLRRSRSVVTVHPPDGFVLGPPPAPVELDNGVCLYRLQVEESDGAFRVERTFLLRSLVIAPEHYEALASFFQQAERAEAIPVVFHRVGSQP
jgi:hypothetical protein